MLYDDKFFDWVDSGARRSATQILPIVKGVMNPNSIIDIGCGRGTWLSVWRELGLNDITGLDGDYVPRERLAIPRENFIAHDLTKAFAPHRRYDLAQCLEVAEHLPASESSGVVSLLCSLSDIVLFSAAQPGQGGENHLNEQTPEFWASLFSELDYDRFDFLRPLIFRNKTIEPWYRYNTFVFANREGQARLSKEVCAKAVPSYVKAADLSTLPWKIRRAFLRNLPVDMVTTLSRANYIVRTFLRRTRTPAS